MITILYVLAVFSLIFSALACLFTLAKRVEKLKKGNENLSRWLSERAGERDSLQKRLEDQRTFALDRLKLLCATAGKIPGMMITSYKDLPMVVSCMIKVRDLLVTELERARAERDQTTRTLEGTRRQLDEVTAKNERQADVIVDLRLQRDELHSERDAVIVDTRRVIQNMENRHIEISRNLSDARNAVVLLECRAVELNDEIERLKKVSKKTKKGVRR